MLLTFLANQSVNVDQDQFVLPLNVAQHLQVPDLPRTNHVKGPKPIQGVTQDTMSKLTMMDSFIALLPVQKVALTNLQNKNAYMRMYLSIFGVSTNHVSKNLDSHLKPYVCTRGNPEDDCRTMRFSSNACLFRHEREMHGAHNHGINPYLCHFENCERGTPEGGFPRHWNLCDHMKRVHGWEPKSDEEMTSMHRRKRGPSTSHSVPMKRTVSKVSAPYPGARISVPRYAPQMARKMQAINSHVPNEFYHVAAQSYGSNPVFATY